MIEEQIPLGPEVFTYQRCLACGHVRRTWRSSCVLCSTVCAYRPFETTEFLREGRPLPMRRGRDRDRDRRGGPDGPGLRSRSEEHDRGRGDRSEREDPNQDDGDEMEGEDPELLYEVDPSNEDRVETGIEPFDRVLDGGFVRGTATMVAGSPGVGKTTILLETGANYAHRDDGVLIIIGEESKTRFAKKARDHRIYERYPNAKKNLFVHSTNNTDDAVERIDELQASIIIVDSLMMLMSFGVKGLIGKEAQVSYAARKFTQRAHGTGEFEGMDPVTVILIAHATKEGGMAGPNAAKHMVDNAVFMDHVDPMDLQPLEDQSEPVAIGPGRGSVVRIRIHGKNRDGNALEKGYFEMTDHGLIPFEPGEAKAKILNKLRSPTVLYSGQKSR